MIVAGPEGLIKNAYRKFNIRGVDAQRVLPRPAAQTLPRMRGRESSERRFRPSPAGRVGERSGADDGSRAATIMR